jgi:hypothetical protein
MKLVDPDTTILVVTGGSAAAAEKDRPLADWVAEEINRRGSGIAYHRAVVLRDDRYVVSPLVHQNPTIAIGGPGANQVAQLLSQVLPTAWSRDERSFVQMAGGQQGRQAVLWGMDASATRDAVEAFIVGGLLDELLERVWSFRRGVM